MKQITAIELKRKMDAGEDIQIIDVRQPAEHEFASIPNDILIPMPELFGRIGEIDPGRETVVYCHSGGRSARVVMALERSGFTGSIYNLAGGIDAWSTDVDPTVPRY